MYLINDNTNTSNFYRKDLFTEEKKIKFFQFLKQMPTWNGLL